MHRFWASLLRPICDAIRPEVIVEIGAADGRNSRHILEYCRERGARCHIIDPTPPAGLAELRDLLAVHGEYHQAPSLDVLPHVLGDLVLVDGDHNWYTVYHELCMLVETARKASRPLPVICVHEMEWPYARRDLYFAAERIPAQFRQPHASKGMLPGQAALAPKGGMNRRMQNAVSEGGPRNGVRTALEDFLRDAGADYRLAIVPGFHGVGVLYPEDLPAATRERLEASVLLSDGLRDHLEAVEADRVRLRVEHDDLTRQLRKLRRNAGTDTGQKRRRLGFF